MIARLTDLARPILGPLGAIVAVMAGGFLLVLAVSSTTTAVISDEMAMRFSNEMPRAPTEGPDS